MLVECERCAIPGAACHGCLISVLWDETNDHVRLDPDEQRVLEVFARAGFDVEVLEQTDTSVRRMDSRRGRRRHVA
jgi:hypothetical protein